MTRDQILCLQRFGATLTACVGLVLAAGCGDKGDGSGGEPVAADPTVTPPAEKVSGTVVTVNGTALTREKLQSQMARILTQPRMAQRTPEEIAQARSQLEKQLIDHFVVRSLLVSEADADKIVVEDSEITETVERLKGQLPEGRTMEAALAAEELTMESFREQLRGDLAARKVVEKKVSDTPEATDEEVAQFYEMNAETFKKPESATARHILFSVDAGADEAAKAEKKKAADDCRAQLLEGADFAKLAGEHSGCPSGKSKGGSLGSFGRGRMVPEFDEAAFSQEIGKIGPVIETQFGYHIVEVTERTEAGTSSLDEVKERIVAILADRKKQKAMKDFVDALKAKAEITYGQ
jgi:peptidyl-prolyl cis-trans isomerase C